MRERLWVFNWHLLFPHYVYSDSVWDLRKKHCVVNSEQASHFWAYDSDLTQMNSASLAERVLPLRIAHPTGSPTTNGPLHSAVFFGIMSLGFGRLTDSFPLDLTKISKSQQSLQDVATLKEMFNVNSYLWIGKNWTLLIVFIDTHQGFSQR